MGGWFLIATPRVDDQKVLAIAFEFVRSTQELSRGFERLGPHPVNVQQDVQRFVEIGAEKVFESAKIGLKHQDERRPWTGELGSNRFRQRSGFSDREVAGPRDDVW